MADRRHRAAAIAAVVLLFLLAMLFAPQRRDVLDSRPSSYLSTPGGAKALFLTLEELGVPVGALVQVERLEGGRVVLR